MSEESKTLNDFLYQGGAFIPMTMPLGDGDLNDELHKAGYHALQSVGDESGLHYIVYKSSKPDWVILFSTTCHYCVIACKTWPDFIDLLVKLSPTALAAIFNQDDLDAINEMLEPTKREIRRRRKS